MTFFDAIGYYELLNSHFVAPKLSKEEFESKTTSAL